MTAQKDSYLISAMMLLEMATDVDTCPLEKYGVPDLTTNLLVSAAHQYVQSAWAPSIKLPQWCRDLVAIIHAASAIKDAQAGPPG